MGLKIKIDEVDFELQKDYADCLDKPLAQLKKHKTAKKSLCEKLEKWLITDDEQSLKLIIDVIVQLSRWCHSKGKSYLEYNEPAQEISQCLFKDILPKDLYKKRKEILIYAHTIEESCKIRWLE